MSSSDSSHADAALWTLSTAALVAYAEAGDAEAVAAGLELLRRERIRLSKELALEEAHAVRARVA
jgi:hypothetical protein